MLLILALKKYFVYLFLWMVFWLFLGHLADQGKLGVDLFSSLIKFQFIGTFIVIFLIVKDEFRNLNKNYNLMVGFLACFVIGVLPFSLVLNMIVDRSFSSSIDYVGSFEFYSAVSFLLVLFGDVCITLKVMRIFMISEHEDG